MFLGSEIHPLDATLNEREPEKFTMINNPETQQPVISQTDSPMHAENPINTKELTPAQRARLYAAALLLIKILEDPNSNSSLPLSVSTLESADEDPAIALTSPQSHLHKPRVSISHLVG